VANLRWLRGLAGHLEKREVLGFTHIVLWLGFEFLSFVRKLKQIQKLKL
jgi:hypothetical protein